MTAGGFFCVVCFSLSLLSGGKALDIATSVRPRCKPFGLRRNVQLKRSRLFKHGSESKSLFFSFKVSFHRYHQPNTAFRSRLLPNVFLLFSRLLWKNVRRIITGRVKDGGGGGAGGGGGGEEAKVQCSGMHPCISAA